MNQTIQTLLGRRSVRRYKSDPVPEEILHQKAQKTPAPRTPVWMKGQPVFESEYAKKMITY